MAFPRPIYHVFRDSRPITMRTGARLPHENLVGYQWHHRPIYYTIVPRRHTGLSAARGLFLAASRHYMT